MVYDRNRSGGYYNRSEEQDYGRDYGSGRDYTYSSARDYQAAGEMGGDRDYGRREYGNRGYEDRDRMYGSQGFGGYNRGRDRDRGSDERGGGDYGGGEAYRGSYASDGRRFTDYGRDEDQDRNRGGQDRDRDYDRNRGYGRSQDRDDDRGFFDRAADEVRSWFGDDDAERRRDQDERRDTQSGRRDMQGGRRVTGDWSGDRVHDHRDRDYHDWRQGQMAALDRDYDEYRRENRSKFENEFSTWRTGRQGQRDLLKKVQEHAEVVGSDGQKVGTVDNVEGDRIKLTKNDPEAGGRHHSIPSSWLQSVEGNKVTLSKSSVEAKTMWRDEEREQGGMSGQGDQDRSNDAQGRGGQGGMLNRSFSGTY